MIDALTGRALPKSITAAFAVLAKVPDRHAYVIGDESGNVDIISVFDYEVLPEMWRSTQVDQTGIREHAMLGV